MGGGAMPSHIFIVPAANWFCVLSNSESEIWSLTTTGAGAGEVRQLRLPCCSTHQWGSTPQRAKGTLITGRINYTHTCLSLSMFQTLISILTQ